MSISRTKMLQVSKCLIGLAVMMLQSCETVDNRRDLLCGNWESVEGKPDVLIYKEGEAYKVTVFKRSGLRRKLKPETYLLQEENGNLFINTGFRIDVSYNEATDILFRLRMRLLALRGRNSAFRRLQLFVKPNSHECGNDC